MMDFKLFHKSSVLDGAMFFSTSLHKPYAPLNTQAHG